MTQKPKAAVPPCTGIGMQAQSLLIAIFCILDACAVQRVRRCCPTTKSDNVTPRWTDVGACIATEPANGSRHHTRSECATSTNLYYICFFVFLFILCFNILKFFFFALMFVCVRTPTIYSTGLSSMGQCCSYENMLCLSIPLKNLRSLANNTQQ